MQLEGGIPVEERLAKAQDRCKSADLPSKSMMVAQGGAFQFTFYCELCDSGYTTPSIAAEGVQEAFNQAQQEARRYFNRCHHCHRWVCDGHYNEDLMMCTACAPRTALCACQRCGAKNAPSARFCVICGASLG